jgi:hypothetical protein
VKSTKIKEVVFHIFAPNYLDFLTTMLTKCEKLSVFKVTAKKRCSFKYIPGAVCHHHTAFTLGVGGHLTNVIQENGMAFLISLERTGRDIVSAVE